MRELFVQRHNCFSLVWQGCLEGRACWFLTAPPRRQSPLYFFAFLRRYRSIRRKTPLIEKQKATPSHLTCTESA
jgi:hypothetical protein